MEEFMEDDIFKILFYKDSSIIILINLMDGNYFVPSIKSENNKKLIIKKISSKFHITVEDIDILSDEGQNFVFVGEWEGLFSVDDDVLRSKWVKFDEIKDKGINKIREKYRDIVDKKGKVIAIATLSETDKYNLRYRLLKHKDKIIPFLLGESVEGALKRYLKSDHLSNTFKKKITASIRNKTFYSHINEFIDDKYNAYVYEISE